MNDRQAVGFLGYVLAAVLLVAAWIIGLAVFA